MDLDGNEQKMIKELFHVLCRNLVQTVEGKNINLIVMY